MLALTTQPADGRRATRTDCYRPTSRAPSAERPPPMMAVKTTEMLLLLLMRMPLLLLRTTKTTTTRRRKKKTVTRLCLPFWLDQVLTPFLTHHLSHLSIGPRGPQIHRFDSQCQLNVRLAPYTSRWEPY